MNKSLQKNLCCILIIILSICSIASASEIEPRADLVFDSATTVLKSTKKVSFRCATYDTHDRISVIACWLEIENSDGTWSYVCSLTPPTTVHENTFAYTATEDYSSQIGTGNFRIWATYDADGHSITRCSNERSF